MCLKTDVYCGQCQTIFQSNTIICERNCRYPRIQRIFAQCLNCTNAILVGHQINKISDFNTFKRNE